MSTTTHAPMEKQEKYQYFGNEKKKKKKKKKKKTSILSGALSYDISQFKTVYDTILYKV